MAEAAELRRWLDCGANAVKRARGRLDAINVFPVADSDTGTNIYLTLREGNRAVGDLPAEATHKEVVAAFARGALLGARGNSGVIVSAYLNAFLGAVDARGGLSNASAADISASLDAASSAAYSAVGAPVEGTILTVAKAAATAASGAVAQGAGKEATIVTAVVGARAALAKTQAQLGPAEQPALSMPAQLASCCNLKCWQRHSLALVRSRRTTRWTGLRTWTRTAPTTCHRGTRVDSR